MRRAGLAEVPGSGDGVEHGRGVAGSRGRRSALLFGTSSLSPVLRGEGRGEGRIANGYNFHSAITPLTLSLSPEYRGEGTGENSHNGARHPGSAGATGGDTRRSRSPPAASPGSTNSIKPTPARRLTPRRPRARGPADSSRDGARHRSAAGGQGDDHMAEGFPYSASYQSPGATAGWMPYPGLRNFAACPDPAADFSPAILLSLLTVLGLSAATLWVNVRYATSHRQC